MSLPGSLKAGPGPLLYESKAGRNRIG